ncbi:PREDICTED: uncharacterized protein LOC104767235 [Camelina sativa]|uniref:Uncharacterized protein LOC104767234 n=1 Tax=Camelina sativa TaxID=90675 RepID=A0ABM1RCD5_CAMSA|nr:PREDICTED: uncharacterized protein LOC104767234 [Camelina sativa]XP_019096673.1 PREDICTED: uncharacterized protein LOC104767235 [Camelina sativa]
MGRFAFLNVLKEVAGILNESCKLFLKNKKLMFSVLVLPLLLNCLAFLFNVFVIEPEVMNVVAESSLLPTIDPSTPEYAACLMKIFADVRQYVGSSYILTAVSSIINIFSVIVMVHASALTLKDENIKIKDFTVLSLKSWKGPLVTYFYIALFSLGYWLLFFLVLCPLLLSSSMRISDIGSLAVKTGVLLIIFALFQSNLAIVWNLSMVISVLEESYGIQALGKAAKIVKGMKTKLFLVNIFFGLLALGLAQILSLVINLRRSVSLTVTTGFVFMCLVFVCLVFAVRMFMLVTYTVAYFQCKSFQGKDVESLTDVEYTNLSSTALMG